MKAFQQGCVSIVLSRAAQSCAGPRACCLAWGGCQDRAKIGSVSEDEDVGRPVLRIAQPSDAVALMKLKKRLDEETSFMLLEPDERDTSIQALARHLEEVSQSENSVVIVAGRHGDLAGYVELAGGKFRRKLDIRPRLKLWSINRIQRRRRSHLGRGARPRPFSRVG